MKKPMVFILILVAAAALVSCSNQAQVTEQVNTAAVQETAAPDEVSAVDDKDGGTIVLPISGDPSTWLAWKMRNDIEDFLVPILYEPLMRCDENGNPQPFLLSELTPDADAKTYTMKVRPGIKFHDGSTLTADVVKWNIEHYLTEGVLASSFYKNVGSVETTDKDTVVVHMINWDSLLPYAMTRSLYMTSKEAFEKGGAEGLEVQPVGTGAFKFESWEHGTRITFARFDDYWQGKPHLDKVVAEIYGNNLVIQAAMEAGNLDAFVASDYDMAKEMETKGFTLIKSAIPSQAYTLNYNSFDTTGPLANAEVRKAVGYAIDKNAIVDALCKGFCEASTQWSLPGNVQYNSDIVGFPYDPEKAKQMLADAGYPDGFEVNLTCRADDLVVDSAQILAEQLAAVGIKVNLNPLETSNYSTHIAKWDGILYHQMNVWSSMYSQMSACMSRGVKTGLGVEGFAKIPEIEDTIDLARSTGGDESQSAFQQAVKYVFEDYAMMNPVFVIHGVTVVNPKLHDSGIGAITPGYYTLHLAWLDK